MSQHDEMTPESLPKAIKSLFELNHYTVESGVKIHGAEVDLVAKSKTDPFARTNYIEATVEYVDNTKYGKDCTKFIMLRKKDPESAHVIVSSKGFTPDVMERAKEAQIYTVTYSELFQKFQKFSPIIDHVLREGAFAKELADLNSVYEPPNFKEEKGFSRAVEYLDAWKMNADEKRNWVVVVGEYGTGKTALSKFLLHKWTSEYLSDPSNQIPFRIELRDFTRQFNADGLIHHFLDKNGLSHVPIEFVKSLMVNGRIIFILDGYDEMANYMHVRERRSCLEALAELSSGKAKGILTSRPNYFSESEELQIMELLYKKIDVVKITGGIDESVIRDEEKLDQLLQHHFLSRHEKALVDLDDKQTEALVRRSLKDRDGEADILLALLGKIREVSTGPDTRRHLGGKPVIITYLLDIVKDIADASTAISDVNEWNIYELIVQKLMLRDHKRAPEMLPSRRLDFLTSLAYHLWKIKAQGINEEQFKDLIRTEFATELSRHHGTDLEDELERLFGNLRSSATLSRADLYWHFSHNSLREFIIARGLISSLDGGKPIEITLPITDAMQEIVASKSGSELNRLSELLAARIQKERSAISTGLLISLIYPALRKAHLKGTAISWSSLFGEPTNFCDVRLQRISFSPLKDSQNCFPTLVKSNVSGAFLTSIVFNGANLAGADLSGATLETCSFIGANCNGSSFVRSTIIECDFSRAEFNGTDFTGVSNEIAIIANGKRLCGYSALGWLALGGAKTDPIDPIFKCMHHSNWNILVKIAEKLLDSGWKQYRGLTQRGTASSDTPWARQCADAIIANGWVEFNSGRELLCINDAGRPVLGKIVSSESLPEELARLF